MATKQKQQDTPAYGPAGSIAPSEVVKEPKLSFDERTSFRHQFLNEDGSQNNGASEANPVPSEVEPTIVAPVEETEVKENKKKGNK